MEYPLGKPSNCKWCGTSLHARRASSSIKVISFLVGTLAWLHVGNSHRLHSLHLPCWCKKLAPPPTSFMHVGSRRVVWRGESRTLCTALVLVGNGTYVRDTSTLSSRLTNPGLIFLQCRHALPAS